MIVALDFETFYSKDYSLSKISEVEYILDPRFQVIMGAVKVGDKPTETYVGYDAVAERLRHIDWGRAALCSHNTRFDGAILAWRFGIIPKLYLDTLSMARATTHWRIGKSALKNVSDYLGLPPKGDEVIRALGKRLEDFTYQELEAYRAYCARDNDNCRAIFDRLRPIFSATELTLIDLILRMFILPQVQLDAQVLSQHLDEVQEEKARALAHVEATVTKEQLASNQKFAKLLNDYGVEVPMKLSPTTGGFIPAVAKQDRAFKELCMDDTQPIEVQALLAARLSVKSTIEETRTANLLRLSRMTWPTQGVGWGPVPLKYSGARTHRLSGDGGTNWQNFQRGSLIRAAIRAPEGYRVLHRDASQIEARMTAWLAGCTHLIHAFAQDRDVYSEFASVVYGYVVLKDVHKLERFVGKTSILGLGYGCGPTKFRHMLFIGNGGVSLNVSEEFAREVVQRYRVRYYEIRDLWITVEYLLGKLIAHSRGQRRQGPTPAAFVQLEARVEALPVEPGHDALWLPSGLCIAYPGIRYFKNTDTGNWEMGYDDPYGGARKIYGAKGVENISQALARIVVTDIAVRVKQLTGYTPFLSTHDSLDYCVPVSDVERLDEQLEHEFSLTPTWAEGLPLASEGGWGRTLLDAERRVNA